jgi:hypothetical protein
MEGKNPTRNDGVWGTQGSPADECDSTADFFPNTEWLATNLLR